MRVKVMHSAAIPCCGAAAQYRLGCNGVFRVIVRREFRDRECPYGGAVNRLAVLSEANWTAMPHNNSSSRPCFAGIAGYNGTLRCSRQGPAIVSA